MGNNHHQRVPSGARTLTLVPTPHIATTLISSRIKISSTTAISPTISNLQRLYIHAVGAGPAPGGRRLRDRFSKSASSVGASSAAARAVFSVMSDTSWLACVTKVALSVCAPHPPDTDRVIDHAQQCDSYCQWVSGGMKAQSLARRARQKRKQASHGRVRRWGRACASLTAAAVWSMSSCSSGAVVL